MGSITPRKRKDGKTSYLAQIVIKSGGRILHRENKTFPARREAAGWIARREEELSKHGYEKANSPTLAEVIDRYTAESEQQFGKTKKHVLATVKAMPIGAMRCSDITSVEVLALAQQIKARGVKPQTVKSYISHLGGVFSIAKPAWGYPLDYAAISDTSIVAKKLGVAYTGKERERRPTLDDLNRLMAYFGRIRELRPHTNPMQELVLFGIFSTRRQEEITRIRWADLDTENNRVLVRDMKHPGDKIGNDQWVDLPPEAIAVIERQPKTDSRIFPYKASAVSAAFTRACAQLSIIDLHFHDLRHEGISRLFELGWTIPHVAAVSGHRSWHSLKRYTHVRQKGDKYTGWQWLPQ